MSEIQLAARIGPVNFIELPGGDELGQTLFALNKQSFCVRQMAKIHLPHKHLDRFEVLRFAQWQWHYIYELVEINGNDLHESSRVERLDLSTKNER